MDAPYYTGDDDRDTLDARRDAPIKARMVPCTGCGDPVRVLTGCQDAARVWCWECWAHGRPIRRT